jgi:hypothetical protein
VRGWFTGRRGFFPSLRGLPEGGLTRPLEGGRPLSSHLVQLGKAIAHGMAQCLRFVSVITTLLFIVGSPWVVLRGTRSVLRASAWVAAAAFFLNAHWLLGTEGRASGLGVGYFFWWCSFIMLALALFDLAGPNDAAVAAHSQTAVIPR